MSSSHPRLVQEPVPEPAISRPAAAEVATLGGSRETIPRLTWPQSARLVFALSFALWAAILTLVWVLAG